MVGAMVGSAVNGGVGGGDATGGGAAGGVARTGNNRSKLAVSASRWLMLKLIAAKTARDVSSRTAGLIVRGGVNTSAPLLRSGASGGTWLVSSV
jgi:hypothetical protein